MMRAGLAALLCLAVSAGPALASQAHAQAASDAVAGLYDGHQTEMAAWLELGTDGRYRYQVSYGALDEWSAGTWTSDSGAVVLTSDPFTPPAFDIADDGARNGALTVRMDLPTGMDQQYFGVTLVRADQSASFESMSADGIVLPMGDNPVVSLRPVLSIFDLIGPTFEVPAGGAALRIAFKPNDLGFAGFDHERLTKNGEAYELPRYGRTIRFRKVEREAP